VKKAAKKAQAKKKQISSARNAALHRATKTTCASQRKPRNENWISA